MIIVTLLINASHAAFAEDEGFELLFPNMDVVLTPTRLKQNKRDVPASVTVITASDIKKLRIRSVPEALRLVPGMAVNQINGNVYGIEYHGTNGLAPRRMQVLIDGVSYFRAGFSQVFWKALPVAIEDIHRIEVTRSPSAASYGENSFFAVVNIITKHPADVQGARAILGKGSLNEKNAFIAYGGKLFKNIDYRVSFSHQQDSGFDKDHNNAPLNDDSYLNVLNFRLGTQLDNHSEIELLANIAHSSSEDDSADPNQIATAEQKENDTNFVLNYINQATSRNQVQVKTYYNRWRRDKDWSSCYPAFFFSEALRAIYLVDPVLSDEILANLPALPEGNTAEVEAFRNELTNLGAQAFETICGTFNEDYIETRIGAEIQNTHVFSESLRFVAGFGLNHNRAESETYLNGKFDIDHQYIFSSIEYKPFKQTTVNIGAMWEKEEHHTNGIEFSPRVALNYHITPNHTVRFVHARAKRTPDMLESDREWSYTLKDTAPEFYNGENEGSSYILAKASNTLRSENIQANEISYYGRLPKYDISVDLKLFHEELDNLISEKLEIFNFRPTNGNSATLKGSEVQVTYQPKGSFSAFITYAYLDNESSHQFERSLYARHRGAVYFSYLSDNQLRTTLAYFGSSRIAGYSYNRYDLILSKLFKLQKNSLDTSIKIQYYTSKRSGFIVNEDITLENSYDDQIHYLFSVSWQY